MAFSHKVRLLGESAASQARQAHLLLPTLLIGYAQQASNVKNTCGNFKRLLGRKFNDPEVQSELARSMVKTVPTRDGGVGYQVYYNGDQKVFSATQVAAMYLYNLREIAEKESGSRVHDVCISTPVWYSDQQRRALIDAAHIAGFNVLALLNDNTACTCRVQPSCNCRRVGGWCGGVWEG